MNVEDFAEQPSARFLKVVDVSQPTDIFSAGQPPDGLSVANGDGSGSAKLIAYGKWNVPTRSPTTGELVSGGDDPDAIHEGIWPEGGDRELATEFFGELARRRRRIMGAERGEGLRPHAYLEIVCTLPEYQGPCCASFSPLLPAFSHTSTAKSSSSNLADILCLLNLQDVAQLL